MVLRVDEEKGYIDLSKRRVSPEEAMVAEERYAKSRMVHTIVSHVAYLLKRNLLELNQKLTWPLYRKYGHAYDAFRQAASDPVAVFGEFNLDPELQARLWEKGAHGRQRVARLGQSRSRSWRLRACRTGWRGTSSRG